MSRNGKRWASLITNEEYLEGLLTLEYSLRKVGTKYQFVAIYPDDLPDAVHEALDRRHIQKRRVSQIRPTKQKDFSDEPRFYETWSKLAVFSLSEYERVVLLDCDMLVVKNIDELMDLPLDDANTQGCGNQVFAAGHACACNPLHKPHYPAIWRPENCAFTWQHEDVPLAQREGAPTRIGVGKMNSGVLVVIPSDAIYDRVMSGVLDPTITGDLSFPDQDLLSALFKDKWVPLPYIYNALKTMRWKGVHDTIWRDEQVKIIHFILCPKPWADTQSSDPLNAKWHAVQQERISVE